ncbi:efflux RND transporter periplasmic adaptor subunit [Pseudoxanthomonas sp.]|uniref:efflux RND transporter periplasmic adaptor subunit n=1 Tax=Pseudoxanthomonas sp. TaxID=1871049 RepID=UPI0026182713|nr:efflux RND transporter periplasmic adaptor subunit [Pseudoxanthomonas sp.]WDS37755.1 MAG: efflux RND transporter periplasmic adaptor subunit [Pseudoxanthomonas sp.]
MSDTLKPRTSARRPLVAGLLIALVLVGAGLGLRAHRAHDVAQWTADQALPVVRWAAVSGHGGDSHLDLPAHLEAWTQAPIHARVGGYLKAWHADIGTRVVAGQLLAEIDSPELDQQIAQAHAALLHAKANASLARTSATRWLQMLGTHSVSRQESDEKHAEALAADASVEAAQADYQRLTDLGSYRTLRAPFAGTLTARLTDVGQLVRADDSGRELFDIADTRKLRLMVPIPQSYAGAITHGLHARLQVPDQPGRYFDAVLQGDSAAVDRSSGSLLAQFVVDNADGALLPGAYAQVQLPLPAADGRMRIPASALIFRANGTQVAVLDEQNHVHLRDIHIAMDLGSTLEIDHGLKAGEHVIDNPPDALREGDPVRIAAPDKGAAHASAA